MSPTGKPCRSRRLVLFAAVLALAGCGVSDYEAKMQEAEVRIQRIDKENELLGDPLEMPIRPDGGSLAVFLRPPRGVSNTSLKDAFPYHYTATSGVCTDVYVAFADGPQKVEKLIEDTFEVPLQKWQAVTVTPPDRKELSFEAVEFLDPKSPPAAPASCQAYVRGSVGVVFRFLTAKREAAMPSLKMSMETFAEGGEALKARGDFKKRKAH